MLDGKIDSGPSLERRLEVVLRAMRYHANTKSGGMCNSLAATLYDDSTLTDSIPAWFRADFVELLDEDWALNQAGFLKILPTPRTWSSDPETGHAETRIEIFNRMAQHYTSIIEGEAW